MNITLQLLSYILSKPAGEEFSMWKRSFFKQWTVFVHSFKSWVLHLKSIQLLFLLHRGKKNGVLNSHGIDTAVAAINLQVKNQRMARWKDDLFGMVWTHFVSQLVGEALLAMLRQSELLWKQLGSRVVFHVSALVPKTTRAALGFWPGVMWKGEHFRTIKFSSLVTEGIVASVRRRQRLVDTYTPHHRRDSISHSTTLSLNNTGHLSFHNADETDDKGFGKHSH